MRQMQIHSDLQFSFEEPARQGLDGRRLSGTVEAAGQHIEVSLDSLPEVSVRGAAPLLRTVAAALRRQQLTLSVRGPDGVVLTIGDVRSRVLDRLLTRSRSVRLQDLRGVLRLVRSRPGQTSRLTVSDLMPPPMLWPPAPTFRPQPRRVTTTHDPYGGGAPRLLFASDGLKGPQVFFLKPGVRIGSADECDLQLPGIDPVQAQIRRNDQDEYLVLPVGTGTPTLVNGRPVTTEQLLRTGTRVQLGSWVMSYFRAEDADHGRPYGGRIGGELGYQRPQRTPRYVSPGPHAG